MFEELIPPPKNHHYSKLSDLLPKVTAKYNLSRTFKALQICKDFPKLTTTIFPPNLIEQIQAKSYQNSILTLSVTNSALAQEIQMRKHLILDIYNLTFGQNTLTKINIHIE